MSLPRLSLCTAAVLLALSSLNAQSVATAPVGAVTKTLDVGLNSVGISLLNPDLVVAQCTANTANTLTLNGVSNIGALLTSGEPYYVEVTSGDLEGERFDVDTAATISAANGSIVLNSSSANNTFALTADVAVGSTFALRKHITLAQIQTFITTPLIGNNSPDAADQIWLFNPTANAFSTYYLRGDGVTWRLSGNPANANNLVIAPGTGIIIKKLNTPATLAVTGGVRVNDFAFPLPSGLSFRAPGYPVNYSPASLGGTSSMGWTASNSPDDADQLQLLNAAGTAFSNYYLRADGVNWRLSGNPVNVQNNELFAYDSAFMVSRKTEDNNYILTTPFNL